MEKATLGGELEVYCVNRGEARLLYEDLFRDRSYLQFGLTLNPSSTVVDVGANIGLFTLFAHLEAPNSKIYSIEPIPDLFEVLKANIALHNVDAVPIGCGLSDRLGSSTFVYYPENSALSGQYGDSRAERILAKRILLNKAAPEVPTSMIDHLLDSKFDQSTFECKLTTLSALIQEFDITKIDFLKIDVEKAEMEVLHGIAEPHWGMVKRIAVEVHDIHGRVEETVRLLRGHDFHVEVCQNPSFAGTELFDVYARREDLNRAK